MVTTAPLHALLYHMVENTSASLPCIPFPWCQHHCMHLSHASGKHHCIQCISLIWWDSPLHPYLALMVTTTPLQASPYHMVGDIIAALSCSSGDNTMACTSLIWWGTPLHPSMVLMTTTSPLLASLSSGGNHHCIPLSGSRGDNTIACISLSRRNTIEFTPCSCLVTTPVHVSLSLGNPKCMLLSLLVSLSPSLGGSTIAFSFDGTPLHLTGLVA